MRGNFWRLLVALFDGRGWVRRLRGQPAVDVVLIANVRDEAERRLCFGNRMPHGGHAAGPRIYVNGVASQVRAICVTAEELFTKEGRRKAQAQFIAACEWAEGQGAKVILLAASTKRLFGRDGHALKARFPSLLFTIGDNGTAQMLWADTRGALERARVLPGQSRVIVIGPYGILGSCVTQKLVQAGYTVIGYGANESALADVSREFGIPVSSRTSDIGQVDAVVACTHSAAAKLTPDDVACLRRPGRKLLVIDVAEPANLDSEAYARCREGVVRQDAGNAFSRRLSYVLGPLGWRTLILSRGVVFGCFAEAITLYHAIHRLGRRELAEVDWFGVDDARTTLIAQAFETLGFVPPTPRCFGKAIGSYQLVESGA